MAHIPESLNMDHPISFRKKNHITISKNVAILVLATFVVSLVAVGLLSHYLTVQSDTTSENPCGEDHHEMTTTTEPPRDRPSKYLRLPRSIVPVAYDIRILTFMDNFTFHGWTNISVAVLEDTSNVTIHVHRLNVSDSTVRVSDAANNVRTDVERCSEDKELQFFVVHLMSPLSKGRNYTLTMEFDGRLNDDLAGFYRSSYKVGNETKWLASTQFEPTDARQAFPCFDEPAMKATFKITLGRPKNVNSISNMPRISSKTVDGHPELIWDEFQRSVPMSTYLVAFLVSDFTHLDSGNFSLWARDSAINQTEVALKLGPQFLEYFTDYFNVSFPLPKMDMAAIPDFSAGAMENWGLITYRENALLYQNGISTKKDLTHIAMVIAHELSHQWFGNLVTMKWWSDLWLNEGFASYMENLAPHHMFPEWRVMDMFVVHYLHVVFNLDGLESSHPISVVVNDPDEISDIFDRISYYKGASIIRMMEHFLSTSVFQKGLTKYLNDMKYKNAEQDDLWECLTFQARKEKIFGDDMSVKIAMDPWTLQTGYPFVTVTRVDNKRIRFSQQRFLLSTNKTDTKTLWGIPLSYIDKSGANKGIRWMKQQDRELEVVLNKSLSETDWLLLNVNQTGYFRVNYDEIGWTRIVAQLREQHKVFDVKNRAQILDDSFNLARAGYLNYNVALNVSLYLSNEEEYIPWKAAFNNLDFINDMFLRSGSYEQFKDYLLSLMQEIYEKVGFKDSENDSLHTTNLRGELLRRACKLGHMDCLSKAIADFRSWMAAANPDTDNPIPSNNKYVVYCTAIELMGSEAWNFAWQRYQNANVATEKELLLSALGCTETPWLISRFMTMAITENSGIRKQDIGNVFSALSRNIIGQTIGFRFVMTNWEEINKYVGKTVSTTSGILKSVTRNMNTEKELEEVQTFAKKHARDGTTTQRSMDQVIEQTRANIDWTNKHFRNISSWLTNLTLKSESS